MNQLTLRRREAAVPRTAPPLPLRAGTTVAELRRAAAEQDWPRLRVWREFPRVWVWQLTGPHGHVLDGGHTDSHPAALTVGLAALEAASVRPASA